MFVKTLNFVSLTLREKSEFLWKSKSSSVKFYNGTEWNMKHTLIYLQKLQMWGNHLKYQNITELSSPNKNN